MVEQCEKCYSQIAKVSCWGMQTPTKIYLLPFPSHIACGLGQNFYYWADCDEKVHRPQYKQGHERIKIYDDHLDLPEKLSQSKYLL